LYIHPSVIFINGKVFVKEVREGLTYTLRDTVMNKPNRWPI